MLKMKKELERREKKKRKSFFFLFKFLKILSRGPSGVEIKHSKLGFGVLQISNLLHLREEKIGKQADRIEAENFRQRKHKWTVSCNAHIESTIDISNVYTK